MFFVFLMSLNKNRTESYKEVGKVLNFIKAPNIRKKKWKMVINKTKMEFISFLGKPMQLRHIIEGKEQKHCCVFAFFYINRKTAENVQISVKYSILNLLLEWLDFIILPFPLTCAFSKTSQIAATLYLSFDPDKQFIFFA